MKTRSIQVEAPARHAVLYGLALASAIVVAGCHRKQPGPAAETLPAVAVQVRAVEMKKHQAVEEVVGTVRAKLRAVIEAKIAGRIEQMTVSPGQTVKAGELLTRLDMRETQARLDQAVAVRQQAERDLKRFGALLQQQAVTQQEYDAVEARHRVGQAAVTEAETVLGYGKVTAPFDGLITRKLADVGDLAGPGRPLYELEDPAALRLEADVPEAIFMNVRLGATMAVRIGGQAGEFAATVSEIAPAADPVSRTLRVKLDLPPRPGLVAGQFGRVSVPVSETQTLRAPCAAVIQRGQMEIVLVVTNQQARLRLVKTGKQYGDEIELVSGLNAGEQVVVEGASTLRDGQPVTIR